MKPAAKVKQTNIKKDTIEYVDKSFDYVKSLNKLEDSRSQSIVILNALLFTFLGLFTKEIQTITSIQILLLTISLFFCSISILSALKIGSSKVKDMLSPIHHTGIRQYESWEKYNESILEKSREEMLSDICRETWVVAGITAWRGKQVKIASFFFLLALVTSIIFWAGRAFMLY